VEGLGFLFLWLYGDGYAAFVVVTGMLFFAYGEMFSLFPASLADTFGRKHVSSVYGMLYTAKGVGSLLIPVADVIWEADGSWRPVIIICFGLSFGAAFLVVAIIRPFKRKFIMAIKEKHGGIELDNPDDDDEEESYH